MFVLTRFDFIQNHEAISKYVTKYLTKDVESSVKEVNAKSMCGIEIVVEQIFENTLEKNLASAEIEQNWLPLSKIVISDKVINLDQDNTFAHPRTGKVFKLLNS